MIIHSAFNYLSWFFPKAFINESLFLFLFKSFFFFTWKILTIRVTFYFRTCFILFFIFHFSLRAKQVLHFFYFNLQIFYLIFSWIPMRIELKCRCCNPLKNKITRLNEQNVTGKCSDATRLKRDCSVLYNDVLFSEWIHENTYERLYWVYSVPDLSVRAHTTQARLCVRFCVMADFLASVYTKIHTKPLFTYFLFQSLILSLLPFSIFVSS